jgi:hypothetical protein
MISTALEESISQEGSLQNAEIAQQALPQHDSNAKEKIRGTFQAAKGFAGYIVAILAGIAVFRYTGLYDAVDSTAGKIGLGSAIVYWHVIMFRLGRSSK